MHDPNPPETPGLTRVGSLFSGYGGLDLAVERVFNAQTVWHSEVNEHVSRVLTHHWPTVPNLGDITTIDWGKVQPVDVLCGGFPCQDVSTVGKMTGLVPGTRSGLWSYMAKAIGWLRPKYVVIENVLGLLSATATRGTPEGEINATSHTATLRGMEPDFRMLGDESARPLRALGAVLGDLADLRYDARWLSFPASAIGAPHPRVRVFLLARPASSHSAGIGLGQGKRELGRGTRTARDNRSATSDHRSRVARHVWLDEMAKRIGATREEQRLDFRQWGKYTEAVARWEQITGRQAPPAALFTKSEVPRLAPAFVEWLMGLDAGWVSNPAFGLTLNQQLMALGNGVLPLQASVALQVLIDSWKRSSSRLSFSAS